MSLEQQLEGVCNNSGTTPQDTTSLLLPSTIIKCHGILISESFQAPQMEDQRSQ